MGKEMERILNQKRQVKSALERIDAIEQELPRVISAVNEVLMQNNQRVTGLAEVVEAVVELFGSETVDAKITEVRTRKLAAQAAQAKENLEKAVVEGKILATATVEEDSLIVGRESDAEGNIAGPGRVQLLFSGIRPEFQEKLKGQAAGFSVTTENGGKFEVLEVYKVLPAPEPTPTVGLATEVPAEAIPATTAAPTATPEA